MQLVHGKDANWLTVGQKAAALEGKGADRDPLFILFSGHCCRLWRVHVPCCTSAAGDWLLHTCLQTHAQQHRTQVGCYGTVQCVSRVLGCPQHLWPDRFAAVVTRKLMFPRCQLHSFAECWLTVSTRQKQTWRVATEIRPASERVSRVNKKQTVEFTVSTPKHIDQHWHGGTASQLWDSTSLGTHGYEWLEPLPVHQITHTCAGTVAAVSCLWSHPLAVYSV